MTTINNKLYLKSPENNVYPGEVVDSSLPTGQDVVILPPFTASGNMVMTSNEITLLAQRTIAEMEESPREQPSIFQAATLEPMLEDIFRPISQDEIIGLPVPLKANIPKKKGSPSRNLSSVDSVHMSNILPMAANPITRMLPEATYRSESGTLSTQLLKQGIVPAHLKSSKSIKINVSVPFLISLYKNTNQENKNKISEHINKIGQGLRGATTSSVHLSGVELLEILNLPENQIFLQGDHAEQSNKYLEQIRKKLFVPPVLDANDEHVESFYESINTLFEIAKKNSLKPAIATYFQTYLDLVKDIKTYKTRLSFEKNALIELLNCQKPCADMSKKEQKAFYTLRNKFPLEKVDKRKRVEKETQSISALPNQQRQNVAKVAKNY